MATRASDIREAYQTEPEAPRRTTIDREGKIVECLIDAKTASAIESDWCEV